MEDIISVLKIQIKEHLGKSNKPRARWPGDLKSDILKAFNTTGENVSSFSQRIGISHGTIRSWLKPCVKRRKKSKEKGKFERISLMEKRDIRMQSVKGYSITGLTIKDISYLLKEGFL